MNKNILKVLQRAGESLSKLETTLSLLRMTRLPQTTDEFTSKSTIDPNRCMRSFYSTTSTRRYGLDELIPKSPILPVTGTTEEEASLSSTEAREKLAQQHQTSNATVVGQAWTAQLLRNKSWDDLHALWISLYKEKNALYAEKLAWKKLGYRMPQATRFSKVKLSMNRIKQVMSERMRQEKDPRMKRCLDQYTLLSN